MQATRRAVIRSLATLAAASPLRAALPAEEAPLEEFAYSQVTLKSAPHLAQVDNARTILMGLSDDSLLMPFRKAAGMPAPGDDLGGWYSYRPEYNFHHDTAGFAPGSTFGQWMSALSRLYAVTGDEALRDKVIRLNRLFTPTISTAFFANTRFPAYTFDKLVCGLKDAHMLAHDPDALAILDRTTTAAMPELPGRAIEREVAWRMGKDVSFLWDESYTLPENLFLVSANGGGSRYREMAQQYLMDGTYFDPLARGENVLGDNHAYSYVNALCSAMQAWFVGGSEKHLRAARNGFDFLTAQSFATGGWGPDELLRKPGLGEVAASLTRSHNHFEVPCGGYAHMKLTRYLLRATRDGRYGDSMERIMFNATLGALPLQPDGHAFYYADYSAAGQRVYSTHRWPCCSGTLPQVAADYGINSYLRSPGTVWVNLYLPSLLRWTEGAAHFTLEQDGTYPATSLVRLRVTASKPTSFTLKLRVPAWAPGVSLTLNGKPAPVELNSGFARINRTWKTGDIVELDLPLSLRLEPIDGAHPNTAALMAGPLVLFALDGQQAGLTRAQALSARQVAPQEWRIDTASAPLRLVPYPELGQAAYSTYLSLNLSIVSLPSLI